MAPLNLNICRHYCIYFPQLISHFPIFSPPITCLFLLNSFPFGNSVYNVTLIYWFIFILKSISLKCGSTIKSLLLLFAVCSVVVIFRTILSLHLSLTHTKKKKIKQAYKGVRNKQFKAFPYDFLHAPIVVTISNELVYAVQVNGKSITVFYVEDSLFFCHLFLTIDSIYLLYQLVVFFYDSVSKCSNDFFFIL